MMFRKAIVHFYLFVVLLSFAEVLHASPTPTRALVLGEAASCINFCFAIDGSTSISSRDFSRQLFLATLLTANVPSSLNPGFAAVQYGISNTLVSPLSSAPSEVISAIRSSTQQETEGTFLTGGLNLCFSELFDIANEGPICPRSVIVLMGDGMENIGTDPAERSGLFQDEGVDVIAVGFGSKIDVTALMTIAGEDGFFNASTRSIRNLAQRILMDFGIGDTSETVRA